MTAYDAAAWTDFANTVAGGAAALAGLLFVGLSLNLAEVLKYPGVPARAAATLVVTVAILLTAVFVATPGQDDRALAVELGVIGVVAAVFTAIFGLQQKGSSPHPARAMTSMVLLGVPALLLIVGGVSLWSQSGGGLYWVTAAAATGFASATGNAWVLLVEIKR
jgi:modulator of FtsH protease